MLLNNFLIFSTKSLLKRNRSPALNSIGDFTFWKLCKTKERFPKNGTSNQTP
jgi:hypothetical protein